MAGPVTAQPSPTTPSPAPPRGGHELFIVGATALPASLLTLAVARVWAADCALGWRGSRGGAAAALMVWDQRSTRPNVTS